MRCASLAACLALLGASQASPAREIAGTLNERLVAEDGMARIELKPSPDRDLPGVTAGDRVFRVKTPQFRPAGAPDGISVALVEAKDGVFLFVDTNLDGRLNASERTPYTSAPDYASAREVTFDLRPATPGAPILPFRCRVVTEQWESETRHHFHFTASFRADGYADIGGRRTLVSLPFDARRGVVDVRRGKIGIDANGDGTVDLRGMSGPEVMFAKEDRVILPVGDTYISAESADFASRRFVLKAHAAEDYTYIEVRTGEPLPDFDFTDFDGRARKLSEFRGKHVLLDFWGSWCAPCIADWPLMKAAYERFKNQGFEIVGIDYEYSATADKVRALLEEHKIGWPNARPESVKDLVEKRFRIWGFPTLILLDADGVVVETGSRALGGKALMSTLQRILHQRELPETALAPVIVEAQPLAANIQRLVQALEYLGAPLPSDLRAEMTKAGQARDARKLQELLDAHVLLAVHINPEARVRVARGPAPALLQQAGYTPVVVKIVNESRGTQRLRIGSPQAGPVYAGMSRLSGERMQQQHLRENENTERRTDRFLELEMFTAAPMTANLSGLDVEYAIALVYSSEPGRREATVTFDVGQGTQDLGFRAEVPVLFTVKPAVPVTLSVLDHDGTPTTARLQFVDAQGHVFPPQAKRVAPDLFFQKHIYRAHGEHVLLPPGELTMFYGRGPEYRWSKRRVTIPGAGAGDNSSAKGAIAIRLERWVDPAASGFYSGDHHIHAAGCAHYTSPTQGVDPADMFRQVKGEGLNVGSVLTWGPGFDHQQQFFAPDADRRSEPSTLMKYDIEVSGFGSEALGHVVLLNLKEQIYPGATGSTGWPTWTLPVLRWTKAQGGVAGYAHSGSGLQVDPAAATARLVEQLDADKDGRIASGEAARGLLPESFAGIDTNRDRFLSEAELRESHDRVDDQLPNYAIPELNSVGAQEIFVTAALGVADFISAMDTDRIREWNAWYHLMNSGLPVKASGETDFPCMSGTRVGQGRSYVQLGKPGRVEYAQWCRGIARGRSYVSDGYAHALDFRVNGKTSGDELELAGPGSLTVKANVAFSPETPLEPAYGGAIPVGGPRHVGDTVIKRETRSLDPVYQRGLRLVEVVVNGRVVASREVPADGRAHALEFPVRVERSGWIALRQFPQLHTNPVNVLVAGRPIRASRESALWALACIDQLWRARSGRIAPAERADAENAYEDARAIYRRIASESPAQR